MVCMGRVVGVGLVFDVACYACSINGSEGIRVKDPEWLQTQCIEV